MGELRCLENHRFEMALYASRGLRGVGPARRPLDDDVMRQGRIIQLRSVDVGRSITTSGAPSAFQWCSYHRRVGLIAQGETLVFAWQHHHEIAPARHLSRVVAS
jgi:hypothetical protein